MSPTTGSAYILSYTITAEDHGIVAGRIYQFRVVAVNDVGSSLMSPKLVDVMAATLPSPPINLLQIYSTSLTMAFEWDEPTDNGGTPITDYQIYWD